MTTIIVVFTWNDVERSSIIVNFVSIPFVAILPTTEEGSNAITFCTKSIMSYLGVLEIFLDVRINMSFFFHFSFFFLVLCANYLSVSHLCGFRLSFERKKNLLMHCSSSTLQGGNDTEVKIGQGSSKQPGIWLARTCARLKFSRQWVTATHGQPKCVRSLASASGLQREDPCWVLMQLPYPR